jgi:hypothetical protein
MAKSSKSDVRKSRGSRCVSRGSTSKLIGKRNPPHVVDIKATARAIVKQLKAKPRIWAKGGMGFDVGGYRVQTYAKNWAKGCIDGLICRFSPDVHTRCQLFNAVDTIVRKLPGGTQSASGWNDHPERKVEDIIQLFEKVGGK